jgi:hypothetical protein
MTPSAVSSPRTPFPVQDTFSASIYGKMMRPAGQSGGPHLFFWVGPTAQFDTPAALN